MKKEPLFPVIIASGFGTGFSPVAPGTIGALLATLIWYICSLLFSSILLYITLFFVVVFTVSGIWSANALESAWGKDPSKVVIDEMVGVWIALLAVPGGSLYYALTAFVLFRLFDIFKPLGIRKMEELKGGVGIMMDDIVAGIYSFILLVGFQWIIG